MIATIQVKVVYHSLTFQTDMIPFQDRNIWIPSKIFYNETHSRSR